MSTWLASNLGKFFTAYILPFLHEKFMDWLNAQWTVLKAKRAYDKADKQAKEKYETVINDPNSTEDQRAQAVVDLINHKPGGLGL